MYSCAHTITVIFDLCMYTVHTNILLYVFHRSMCRDLLTMIHMHVYSWSTFILIGKVKKLHHIVQEANFTLMTRYPMTIHGHTRARARTHTHIYMILSVCVCLCVCVSWHEKIGLMCVKCSHSYYSTSYLLCMLYKFCKLYLIPHCVLYFSGMLWVGTNYVYLVHY